MCTESGGSSRGELASGVYYVSGHVFGGVWGDGDLGDDMLHLWGPKMVHEWVYSEHNEDIRGVRIPL